MIRLLVLSAAAVAGIGLSGAAFPAEAAAVPGQCVMTPWGGFCDNPPVADGSFWHCEGAMGFSNCFQACLGADGRPVPTDMNWSTPC